MTAVWVAVGVVVLVLVVLAVVWLRGTAPRHRRTRRPVPGWWYRGDTRGSGRHRRLVAATA